MNEVETPHRGTGPHRLMSDALRNWFLAAGSKAPGTGLKKRLMIPG